MKKLLLLSVLFIGTLSFGQTKPKTKDVDKEANVYLDSLSKVHKVKICSIKEVRLNGVITTSIGYSDKNGDLVYKIIKQEKVKKD
jgi:hypothetical protein